MRSIALFNIAVLSPVRPLCSKKAWAKKLSVAQRRQKIGTSTIYNSPKRHFVCMAFVLREISSRLVKEKKKAYDGYPKMNGQI